MTFKKHKLSTILVILGHILVIVIIFFCSTAATHVDRPSGRSSTVEVTFVPSQTRAPQMVSENTDAVSTAPPTSSRRPVITRSTNQVIRVSTVSGNTPTINAEQIQQELLAALSPTSSSTSRAGNQDADILRGAFYSAWVPPLRTEVGDAKTRARIIFMPDGRVRHAYIETESGTTLLDASVHRVLNTVIRVDGLTDETLRNDAGVTLTFAVSE